MKHFNKISNYQYLTSSYSAIPSKEKLVRSHVRAKIEQTGKNELIPTLNMFPPFYSKTCCSCPTQPSLLCLVKDFMSALILFFNAVMALFMKCNTWYKINKVNYSKRIRSLDFFGHSFPRSTATFLLANCPFEKHRTSLVIYILAPSCCRKGLSNMPKYL